MTEDYKIIRIRTIGENETREFCKQTSGYER